MDPLTHNPLSMGAGMVQLYMMMVCGPVFACVLTKHPSIHVTAEPSQEVMFELCMMIVNLQLAMLSASPARHNCCHCGATDAPPSELKDNPALPRTKACLPIDRIQAAIDFAAEFNFCSLLVGTRLNSQLEQHE